MSEIKNNSVCPIFGVSKKLESVCLPTYEDFFKHFLWTQSKLRNSSPKHPNIGDILKIVLEDLKIIWAEVPIPIISDPRITSVMKSSIEKYKNIKKPLRSRNTIGFENKKKRVYFRCKKKSLRYCKVKRKLNECNFKNVKIISIPFSSTEDLNQLDVRQISTLSNSLSISSADVEDSSDESLSYEKPSKQMRLKLPNFAKACDRTGISNRYGAILANSILEDFKIIDANNSNVVVDKNKIRREREKSRRMLQKEVTKNKALTGLYFDGRKDNTLTNEKIDTKFYRKTSLEEHIVLISEPHSTYFGHVTPLSGSAKDIKNSIMGYLKKNSDYLKLRAVGSDGANVNTGAKNGVIALIERDLGWPVNWFICLFHFNELPLRHLILSLDGVTAGPNQWTGPIGKELKTCEKKPVTKFERIEFDFPPLDIKDLSKDQKYLYEMSIGISNGTISSDLSLRYPGNMCHSRWLTTANRILCLYASKEKPTKNLKSLATFIIRVYFPIWFSIKLHSSCSYGSKHLFNVIFRSRYLEQRLKKIIDIVIQRNAYFAHPENILLAMLGDERQMIREKAVNLILQTRQENVSSAEVAEVRSFNVPPLNMNAKDYTEMIDWKMIEVTEPPLIKDLNEDDLRNIIENGLKSDILAYPCHNQSVERSIKLVTEAYQSTRKNYQNLRQKKIMK
ncbi:unnamed protein product [Euphydryas editha]|uniref:Uncharacterized protein n=1 Tax=Euphydryas editha TaxID=104508 RepID=A0AAU9VFK4_EUPED|nr:unnamed protein product [Euphydryas editha]